MTVFYGQESSFVGLRAACGALAMIGMLGLSGVPAMAQDAEGDLRQAEAALEAAWSDAPLMLGTALFVEGPATGYGAYVPRRDDRFAPNETLYIYAQPQAFGYDRRGRLHTINLVFDLQLLDTDGELLYEQDGFATFDFQSHARNREVMINANVSLTDLPPGDYVLGLRVRDLHKAGEDAVELPFTIEDA